MSDAVAEGMQVSRGSVLCGDEAVQDCQALVLEAKDRVFEVHEHSCDFDEVFWSGIVPGLDDHRVGAEGLHLWLGDSWSLFIVGSRDIAVRESRLMVLEI